MPLPTNICHWCWRLSAKREVMQKCRILACDSYIQHNSRHALAVGVKLSKWAMALTHGDFLKSKCVQHDCAIWTEYVSALTPVLDHLTTKVFLHCFDKQKISSYISVYGWWRREWCRATWPTWRELWSPASSLKPFVMIKAQLHFNKPFCNSGKREKQWLRCAYGSHKIVYVT